ncbi:hypothetical protein EG329_007328 [Mollisiaceae sp. DMI_Dod_QoI]|nr:hypothetical protein EG329_007328 [Helotiales sp. DMI_Dod_QoI]
MSHRNFNNTGFVATVVAVGAVGIAMIRLIPESIRQTSGGRMALELWESSSVVARGTLLHLQDVLLLRTQVSAETPNRTPESGNHADVPEPSQQDSESGSTGGDAYWSEADGRSSNTSQNRSLARNEVNEEKIGGPQDGVDIRLSELQRIQRIKCIQRRLEEQLARLEKAQWERGRREGGRWGRWEGAKEKRSKGKLSRARRTQRLRAQSHRIREQRALWQIQETRTQNRKKDRDDKHASLE